MIKISQNTKKALANKKLQNNLTHVLGLTLHSRNEAVAEVHNWEQLRQHASSVKAHTLSKLAEYLTDLEDKVQEQGGKVVWANTAQEAVEFILDLARRKKVDKVIKGKSMLTEEIHLSEALKRSKIDPIETDLGEYIVQLAGETPSHLLAPALHKSRQEIAELFVDKVGMSPTEDVFEITEIARKILRQHFLTARMGITGVNFGVAETGTIVIVENEGNIRLAVSMPEIHVAVMGIEKVIPRFSDLAVFLKLLTRSATGQKISTYVNLLNGPRRLGEIDGPKEFYLVLVDNGRSRVLEDPLLRQTLFCIRCGACQNICPVYQRLGGHAYESTYQGPIGAILTPQLTSLDEAPEHPHVSSLCGACYDVCPVKIEIPRILLKLREKAQASAKGRIFQLPFMRWGFYCWARVMRSPTLYSLSGRLLRVLAKNFFGAGKLYLNFAPFSHWFLERELPDIPEESFRERYLSQRGTDG